MRRAARGVLPPWAARTAPGDAIDLGLIKDVPLAELA